MTLKRGAIQVGDGFTLPVRVGRWDGRVFLECSDAQEFLHYIGGVQLGQVPKGAFIRAVVVPEEGMFVDVCDELGTLLCECVKLGLEEARKKILDVLIWQVSEKS